MARNNEQATGKHPQKATEQTHAHHESGKPGEKAMGAGSSQAMDSTHQSESSSGSDAMKEREPHGEKNAVRHNRSHEEQHKKK